MKRNQKIILLTTACSIFVAVSIALAATSNASTTATTAATAASNSATDSSTSSPSANNTNPADAAQVSPAKAEISETHGQSMTQIYSFKEKALDGNDLELGKFKGDVLLIVNTASECGYTPQYAGLEDLSKKYSAKGLKVLGFPCNQFGGQEPGDSKTIHSFCQKNYGVDFQMFEKIEVNGPNANPLFVYLKETAPNDKGDIRWNFTKFLVDRSGKIIKRYDSKVKPDELVSDIEKLL